MKSSASSSAQGRKPAAKIACSARTAFFMESKPTARQARNGGSGISFNVASVTTPSRPSEPTNSRVQIEAGFVFVRASADADDGAVGQHDFEAEDVIARDAVFQTARAAGVGGDVAADEIVRAAGGVGRIKQAALFNGFLKFLRDDARLHDGDKISGVDFLDPVHAFQRKHDAAMHGHAAADIAVAGAARGDGNFVLIGKAQNGGNGFGGAGQGDGVGLLGGEPFVAGIFRQSIAVPKRFRRPAKWFLSRRRSFNFAALIQQAALRNSLASAASRSGHLDADAAGGKRIAVHAQGGKFVGDERMKIRRFEPGTDELGFSRAECGEDGDKVHVIHCFGAYPPVGSSGQRHFHFGEDNDAGAGLEQALNLHFDLLADV